MRHSRSRARRKDALTLLLLSTALVGAVFAQNTREEWNERRSDPPTASITNIKQGDTLNLGERRLLRAELARPLAAGESLIWSSTNELSVSVIPEDTLIRENGISSVYRGGEIMAHAPGSSQICLRVRNTTLTAETEGSLTPTCTVVHVAIKSYMVN